jgi:hypothetical protein
MASKMNARVIVVDAATVADDAGTHDYGVVVVVVVAADVDRELACWKEEKKL